MPLISRSTLESNAVDAIDAANAPELRVVVVVSGGINDNSPNSTDDGTLPKGCVWCWISACGSGGGESSNGTDLDAGGAAVVWGDTERADLVRALSLRLAEAEWELRLETAGGRLRDDLGTFLAEAGVVSPACFDADLEFGPGTPEEEVFFLSFK